MSAFASEVLANESKESLATLYGNALATISRLRGALSFYADKKHMQWVPISAKVENGEIARAALEEAS